MDQKYDTNFRIAHQRQIRPRIFLIKICYLVLCATETKFGWLLTQTDNNSLLNVIILFTVNSIQRRKRDIALMAIRVAENPHDIIVL